MILDEKQTENSMKNYLIFPALLMLLACNPGVRKDVENAFALYNGNNFNGWKMSTNMEEVPGEMFWSVRPGGILFANGHPHPTALPQSGLYTEELYGNYELNLEYRYTGNEELKNSGIRVLGSGDFIDSGGAFPASIEVQLKMGEEGDLLLKQRSIQPEEGYELSNDAHHPESRIARRADPGARPDREWTPVRLRAETTEDQGSTLPVWINEVQVNRGIHAEAEKGHIILQSEAADIEFRNINLKLL